MKTFCVASMDYGDNVIHQKIVKAESPQKALISQFDYLVEKENIEEMYFDLFNGDQNANVIELSEDLFK